MNSRNIWAVVTAFCLSAVVGFVIISGRREARTAGVATDAAKISPPSQSSAIPALESSPRLTYASASDSAILRTLVLEVHKSATCGCCQKWVEHMESFGFTVKSTNHSDAEMPAIRRQMGVSESLGSCHTAKIGTYVVEGHVPAEDVMRLLREKTQVAGLAAPGMPVGSPGMESAAPETYDVLSFDKSGATKVFATHGPPRGLR